MNLNEILNYLQIRTVGMSMIYAFGNVINFVTLKTYPILLDKIDLHGCLMIYGIGCVIGFIFVLFVLKETTGQSLDDVGIDANIQKSRTVDSTEISTTT